MEGMEMDVEESEPTANSNHLRRFGLKNTVQTNFGEDYVFQIISKDDLTAMAVSLSSNVVKLYSPVTGQYFGEFKGHASIINQISFSGPTTPNVLHSCSSDGTIRVWDTRSFHQVSSVSAGTSQEIFSFSHGGSGDNLLAAGSKSKIFFWDWRTKKQIACLEESHMDDVTQVQFVPDHQNKLVSASVDGLLCVFDTRGRIDDDDDDHLDSVINVGTSIGKFGFFGGASQKLWCLTHIETLSVWDWKDARIVVNFEDARTLASDSWALDHVDYFVDCHYSGKDERLRVIGGTSAGTLGYFPVNYQGKGAILSPEAILHGGHTGIVRSVLPLSGMRDGPSRGGIFGWTGGEDGRLCCWTSDESSDINRSWISSEMVMKSLKTRRKSRHHYPY